MSKKTYAIMGGTGHIGHVISEKLLEKGHKVRALGRDAKKLEALKAKGAETLSSAADDAKALTEAFRGADGVFTMFPPNFTLEDYPAFQDKMGEAAVQAITAAGVKHVLYLSSVGADQPSGTGPIAALYRQEARLNKLSGVNTLYLRPTSFMENEFFALPIIKHQGVNGGALPADYPLHRVATKDIGEKAAHFLDDLSFTGHSYFDFSGPKEYSMTEVTKALGTAIGKPDLKYAQFPLEDIKKGMIQNGLKPGMAALTIEMYAAGLAGKLHTTQELTAEHRGKTTIEEFAKVFAVVYGQS